MQGAAYRTFGDFTGFLDAMGPYLPPPGDSAAKLLSGLCKCVHGAHMNNAKLMELQGRCVDLWDLMVRPGDILDVIESSSEAPKFPPKQTSIMRRFTAFLEVVIAYCKNYTKDGINAAASRPLLHFQHKQRYDELVRGLSALAIDATFALSVDQKTILLEKVNDKLNDGMPSMPDGELDECLARRNVRDYSNLLHQPHLKALWSKHFMHEQAVRWGLWWTVFPNELALDDTLNEAAKQQLVDLLKDKDSKDAFRRAVGSEDTIFISIDELCLSFPDDSPLLPTVEALLCKRRQSVWAYKASRGLAMTQAGRGQMLTPVKKERGPSAALAQSEQGRQKVSPVQGGAQLFLSYRVSETGRKRHGGDRTVPLLKSALEAQGYSVFVGESDIEGGASWVQAIDVAITDCQVFIPVCSKTYGDTKWTLRELHAADVANKEILPLWHSGDYPPKPVRMYLSHVQRLPRGNQRLVQADFQSLVSDLVAAIKKAGCLPRNAQSSFLLGAGASSRGTGLLAMAGGRAAQEAGQGSPVLGRGPQGRCLQGRG
ncbi:hypothetical protein V8C86DRAFT_27314 [Haematococcus lacustris]